jgi:hypothetical protein
VIREALGIRKRKHLSDETIASLRDRLPTAEKRLVRLISSEGALHLDRLPTLQEADVIREALGIRKRKHLSDETIASLRDRLPTAEKRLVRLISSRARARNGP